MEQKVKVIKNENVVHVDIDDTLLLWDHPTIAGPDKLDIEFAGRTVFLTPHNYHVDLLKTYKERGYYIVFWSANGWAHAQRAVVALNLEELADGEYGHIQTKPCKYMDDNDDPASILGPRVFCKDLTKPAPKGSSITMPAGATGGGWDKKGQYYTFPDGKIVYADSTLSRR
jgi:hypothetical protein